MATAVAGSEAKARLGPVAWLGFVPQDVQTPTPKAPDLARGASAAKDAKETKEPKENEAQRLKDENAQLQHVVELLRAKLVQSGALKAGEGGERGASVAFFPIDAAKELEAVAAAGAGAGAGGAADAKDMKGFYDLLSASLKIPAAALRKGKNANGAAGAGAAVEATAVESVGAAATRAGEVKCAQLSGAEAEQLKATLPRVHGELPKGPPTPAAAAAHVRAPEPAIQALGSEALIVTARPDTDDDSGDSDGDGANEQRVAVLDLNNVEWWTLVEKPTEKQPEADELYQHVQGDGSTVPLDTAADVPDDGKTEAPLLGGEYEVVMDDELSAALADYVAASMARFPDAKRISADEMKMLLETTFGSHEPSTLAKLWGWGNMAYSVYGWGTWAFQLYKDPAMIRIVATGMYKMAKWALVFIL